MKILFSSLTGSVKRPYIDQSVRYRCFNFIEDLEAMGEAAAFVPFEKLLEISDHHYDAIIIHRPCNIGNFPEWLLKMEARGTLVIADYDDLVFDLEYKDETFYNGWSSFNKEDVENRITRNLEALRLFKYVTVSTQKLKNFVQKNHPDVVQVEVIPFGIARSLRSWVNVSGLNLGGARSRVIAYVAGSNSHTADFAYIEESLLKVLESDKSSIFHLIGNIAFGAEISNHPRFYNTKRVDYFSLCKILSRSTLTIAPLTIGEYNQCKACTKFIEAAFLGCGLVSSPLADIERLAKMGAHISFPAAPQQWTEALLSELDLFETTDVRQRNINFIDNHCRSEQQTKILTDFVSQVWRGMSR